MTVFVPQLPLRLQPTAADHGETSVIVDATGFRILSIDSPVWDAAAQLEHPQDRDYAQLILRAVNSEARMADALKALRDLVKLHAVADIDDDADLLWQFNEAKGAALEEADSILLELGIGAPTVNIAAITDALLNIATQEADLDKALRPLMQAAGIDSGDVAGVFFCGPNGECWPTATPVKRQALLREWMHTEDVMSRDD